MNDDREVLIDFNIVTVIFTFVHTLKINVEEKRGKKIYDKYKPKCSKNNVDNKNHTKAQKDIKSST